MKSVKNILALAVLVSLPAYAEDFNGFFTGSYAGGWTATINDNPGVSSFSSFEQTTYNLTIRGATSSNPAGITPSSTLTFSHAVVGTGPTTVSFNSLFFAESLAHEADSADFLVNGEVLRSLSDTTAEQNFSFVLNPGDVFGFRLSSDNDQVANFLQIFPAAIPEPSIAALGLLGGLLLMVRRARQQVS
jgi:hypothetical protein